MNDFDNLADLEATYFDSDTKKWLLILEKALNIWNYYNNSIDRQLRSKRTSEAPQSSFKFLKTSLNLAKVAKIYSPTSLIGPYL